MEKYSQYCGKNIKKLEEKVNKIRRKEKELNDKLKWYGDTMSFDEGWPNTDERKTLRLFHINLNGVTYQNNLLEWEMTIAFLMDMQIDIFGLTEINLDLNNGATKDKLIQSVKHFDKYMKIATSSSLQKVGDTPFKMGGTVTGSNGCWSGRIQRQGSDILGRWSYMALQSRKGRQVIIITTYLPNKPNIEGEGNTIHNQMRADILIRDGQLKDPREETLKDLHKFIDAETKKGNMIFLMGDMNDNLGLDTGQVNSFLRSLRMKMAYKRRHGENTKLPPTHDRGRNCLDLLACSDHVPTTAIVRAGYAPFYFNFFTDHRGVYVDIDIDAIFNCSRPDTTKQIYKRFTTKHVPKCLKYLKKLEEMMETSKVFQQVDILEMEFHRSKKGQSKWSNEEIINKTKTLFTKVSEMMICAERIAGPMPYKDGFPDSPQLRKSAFKVIRIKKYLRLVALGTLESGKEEMKRAAEDLKMAQKELRTSQGSANLLRQEHLEILAEKRCHQWQMSSAEALHIIKESEKSKSLHGKHRRLLKANHDGILRDLMVPAPITGLKNDIKDPRTYISISDSKQMFNILLKRNFNHLMQSNNSMFSNGPLLEECGWYGKEEGMEKILKGQTNVEEMASNYPHYGQEAVEFLKALRYRTDENGNDKEPFTWKFGIKEYTDVFNKTKEETACGPSGIHMSHWKAACERECIARVHAFFYVGSV